MQQPRQAPAPLSIATLRSTDWACLAAVLAVAIGFRALFYTGFFGSDEVTYVRTAANIASGDWRASDYIGATRYGMNLPVALSIYLLGLSQASANLWPFLCSVGEVAIVFWIARGLWSTRIAVVSAGLLALLPLHVHFAGRMMADPPLAFFLSLSVALLLCAAQARSSLTGLGAGLAWGGVFWVKESVALLYLPAFLILTFYLFRFNSRWLWLVTGMGAAVAANCALMGFVAGNFMHIFLVMQATVTKIAALALNTSPWFYLHYLFVDIRHTFLLGYLAVAGVLLYGKYLVQNKQATPGVQFVVLWALLMVGVFSFAVVSFSPVKLVMKQANYMLIFAAPLVLLAGWYLASLPHRIFVPLTVGIALGSVLLAALEQQAVTVFTANSKAAYVYLRDHPSVHLIGTTNNERAVLFYAMMEGRDELHDRVSALGDLPDVISSNTVTNKDIYALLDLQNVNWGNNPGAIRRLADVPACCIPAGTLAPSILGSGHWLVQGLVNVGTFLPMSLQQPYMAILQPVALPASAYLFRVEQPCRK